MQAIGRVGGLHMGTDFEIARMLGNALIIVEA